MSWTSQVVCLYPRHSTTNTIRLHSVPQSTLKSVPSSLLPARGNSLDKISAIQNTPRHHLCRRHFLKLFHYNTREKSQFLKYIYTVRRNDWWEVFIKSTFRRSEGPSFTCSLWAKHFRSLWFGLTALTVTWLNQVQATSEGTSKPFGTHPRFFLGTCSNIC